MVHLPILRKELKQYMDLLEQCQKELEELDLHMDELEQFKQYKDELKLLQMIYAVEFVAWTMPEGIMGVSAATGFFRRSVRFQKLYRCPFGQQCVISKMYRNCCRACRYQKCLRVGLDPNLVQSDWGQSGPKAKGRQQNLKLAKGELKEEPRDAEDEKTEEEELLKMVTSGVQLEQMERAKASSSRSSPLLWHNRSLHDGADAKSPLGMFGALSPGKCQFSSGKQALALAEFLVRAERYCDYFTDELANATFPLNSEQWSLNVPLELAIRQPGLISLRSPIGWGMAELEQGGPVFGRLFARLLVHCMDWASHLPELMELSEEDRKTLLKRRLMRLMWWLAAQRSVPFNQGTQGMVVSGQMFYPRDPALQAQMDSTLRGLLTDAVNMTYDQLIVPMRDQQVSEEESAILRAMALFTPVARLSPEGHRQVLSFQNKYLNALSELVLQRRHILPENGGPTQRIGRLLMLLTSLEQAARIGDDTFAMYCTFSLNGMHGQLNYELHMGGL